MRKIVRKADPVRAHLEYQNSGDGNWRTDQSRNDLREALHFVCDLALAITHVGLYGTVSYNVARRTNEIGISMALGAQRAGVIRMILLDVLAMVVIGLAIGLPVALPTSKFVGSFL